MKRRTPPSRREARPGTGRPADDGAAFVPPYPPSWFDRVKGRIERFPGPFWLVYPLLGLALYGVETLLHWSLGAFPAGTSKPIHAVFTAILPAALLLMHSLDRLAARSFDRFRPILRANPLETADLRFRFTTMPRRAVAIAVVVFLAFGAVVFMAPIPSFGADGGSDVLGQLQLSAAPASAVFNGALMLAVWAAMGTLIYHTIRQLTWVSRIYTRWAHVDLLKPGPFYSLSQVSTGTAIAMIAGAYLILAADRIYFSDPRNGIGAGAFGVLAVLAFVLPLLGVHRVLVAEKERLLDECSDRMKAALDELHNRVDQKDLRDMDALNKAIASLEIERNLVGRIPTWPWQPDTLRTVIVALLLPLILWAAQALLGRILTP